MEKIDLTKCNNLRYKAKIDGNEDYGRICVENADTGLAFLRSDREDGYIAAWHCDEPGVEGCSGRKVTDFEIEPRDPETYRDWQVGDKARNPRDNWSDSAYKEIIFRSGELVICKDGNGDISGGYTCGQLHRLGYRLVLTDIERQIIEQRKPKPYEFKKGEPVLVRDNDENIWILSSFIQFIPTSCFHVTTGVRPSHWKQCIPYNERTMHLLGTSDKEGEK